jgi:hypothetical protein
MLHWCLKSTGNTVLEQKCDKNVYVGSRGLIETGGSDSAVWLRPRDPNFANDYLDFIGENEAICKTALGRESGPWGGLFDEKKPRVENLVTLSL